MADQTACHRQVHAGVTGRLRHGAIHVSSSDGIASRPRGFSKHPQARGILRAAHVEKRALSLGTEARSRLAAPTFPEMYHISLNSSVIASSLSRSAMH